MNYEGQRKATIVDVKISCCNRVSILMSSFDTAEKLSWKIIINVN